jgi:gliding motility-associated-like protein
VSAPGTYSVTVTNIFNCSANDSIQVSYDSVPPSLDLGNDTSFCGSFSRILNVTYSNAIWSTGATASSIKVDTGGTYWVSVTNACGRSSDSIIISQLTPPELQVSNVAPICPGDSLLVTASGADNYVWSTGSTNSSIYINSPGVYYLKGYNNIACSSTDTLNVPQSQVPHFALGNDTTICGSQGLLLKPNVTFGQYEWQDHSTDSVYHVYQSGTYSVTATNSCGSDSSQVSVNVYADDCELLVPTGFSPNNDGINDLFRAHCFCPVLQYSLSVFNRWGQLVYSTNDINSGWDGTFKGVQQAMGVFVYYAQYYNYCSGKLQQVTGNVTLVR